MNCLLEIKIHILAWRLIDSIGWDIWCTPHLTGKCGTRPFFGGSRHRAVAHTRPTFPKNAYGPVGISFIRGASGAGQLTQPSLGEWKPEGKAPWGRRKSPGTETHPARSAPPQHGRPKCYQAPGEDQSKINLIFLPGRLTALVEDNSIESLPVESEPNKMFSSIKWHQMSTLENVTNVILSVELE